MKKLNTKLRAYIENLASSNHFNGVVLAAYKDEVLLQEAYGTSSFQYDIPLAADTKFRIGSLTKAFTAMAVLMLHEEGKLDIHKPIDQYLTDFKYGHRITIHHLLTNTSGLYNFTDSPDYWETMMRKQTSLKAILVSLKDFPLNFEPGEKMAYSNTGYLVLTAIIEKVTGLSYSDFLQKRILDKLGLTNTGIDNGRTIVKGLATGYTVWEEIVNTEHVDMSFPLGAYGMYSNVGDLYIWAQALQNHQLISEELQTQMFSNFEHGYGYGWFIDPEKQIASHFGDINGFVAHVVLDLKQEFTVIVLSNINITPVTKISSDIKNILSNNHQLEETTYTKKEPPKLDEIVGKYSNGTETIEISYNQELFSTLPKMYGVPYKFRLVPSDNAQFISDIIYEKYSFTNHKLEYIDCYGKKSVYSKV